jgi:phosphate transport system substrate-binding protein
VKSFDGSASAIGYTVYYYADDMKMADGLKIISIDGVSPDDETIAAKKYPFLNPYYTVIAASEPADSPARLLYGWLQSPEGQALVKREGYVPVA